MLLISFDALLPVADLEDLPIDDVLVFFKCRLAVDTLDRLEKDDVVRRPVFVVLVRRVLRPYLYDPFLAESVRVRVVRVHAPVRAVDDA